jgi:hypothetical protein
MSVLDGKVAVVAGSGRGIGRASSSSFRVTLSSLPARRSRLTVACICSALRSELTHNPRDLGEDHDG